MTAKPCPFLSCATPDPMVMSGDGLFWLECANSACCVEGPKGRTQEQAIAKWNGAIRVPTDPQAPCHHLTWCPCCNPALVERR